MSFFKDMHCPDEGTDLFDRIKNGPNLAGDSSFFNAIMNGPQIGGLANAFSKDVPEDSRLSLLDNVGKGPSFNFKGGLERDGR